jgi:hypothetical protein
LIHPNLRMVIPKEIHLLGPCRCQEAALLSWKLPHSLMIKGLSWAVMLAVTLALTLMCTPQKKQ